MKIKENKTALKGQQIIAQGKQSGAMAWETDMKIVRTITFIKEKSLFRTSEMTLSFPEIMSLQFRPKGIICLVHRILTDGFSSASFTQGGVSDRSSRNSTVPVPIISGGYYILAFHAGNI